jgi:hypothetical protein
MGTTTITTMPIDPPVGAVSDRDRPSNHASRSETAPTTSLLQLIWLASPALPIGGTLQHGHHHNRDHHHAH